MTTTQPDNTTNRAVTIAETANLTGSTDYPGPGQSGQGTGKSVPLTLRVKEDTKARWAALVEATGQSFADLVRPTLDALLLETEAQVKASEPGYKTPQQDRPVI